MGEGEGEGEGDVAVKKEMRETARVLMLERAENWGTQFAVVARMTMLVMGICRWRDRW